MADQKVSNERRRELEKIDPFQESLLKSMAYAKAYKKQLLLICGALLVVVVVFSGIMTSFKKSERRASDLVAAAVVKYVNAQDPVKGYTLVKDDFAAVFDDYSNTSAGRMAMVKFAKICFDAENYDRSYDLYKQALEVFKDEAGMKNFLLASLGNVCQVRQDLDQAKAYFLQIEKGHSDLLRDEARFALAGLYEASNDTAASQDMYEKIVDGHENSIYLAIAQSKITKSK